MVVLAMPPRTIPILAGPQDYAPGTLFDVLAGTLILNTDAANLTLRVANATVLFVADQHLDTLILNDGATARFAGARVVVLNHLIFNGLDLGAATLTPEPAAISLLALLIPTLFTRRRG
jgi:hypothetical protein